ncbi:MAG: D-alanyl-D-alanine carboxypeptidase/D-alanyl-D-alanine-endopeptidase [Prevotella sp.]|nr:D-alanyl-D-alanine carboxypeptidase/D-alanyl-D-alanine-endopeptidase [Prevotella sp.]
MKKQKRYLLTIIFAGCSFFGLQAQTEELVLDTAAVRLPWPENLQARIDTLIEEPLFDYSQLGLMVYDLTADSVLYSYGEKQTLRPASTMKLLTAVTALDRLGPNYQFRTSLRYTGSVVDSVLTGDIYCVGGMDPMFETIDMNAFVESILRLGVKTIRGNMVAVTSFKEPELLGEGWCWDDDNPQLTPLLISRQDAFMSRFIEMLRAAEVEVDAMVTSGPLPKESLTICTRSHSLREILLPMMKDSDNLYAESMFFQVAAADGSRPAKAVHGRQAVKQLLGKAGVNNIQYRITDGSGLSLYNYVTPELMIRLLIYAYRQTNIFRELYPSLPVAGQDGTLKKRMTESVANGRVRAKTGTVTGVTTLAGYCASANGHMLAFSIMNQGVLKIADGRDFQDRLCAVMTDPDRFESPKPKVEKKVTKKAKARKSKKGKKVKR